VTYESLSNLLQSSADANMNIVRVWGGGIYQWDAYYSIADQLGLLVWQEFMFGCALAVSDRLALILAPTHSCAMYPRNDEFLDTVSYEIPHQVRLLRSPSATRR